MSGQAMTGFFTEQLTSGNFSLRLFVSVFVNRSEPLIAVQSKVFLFLVPIDSKIFRQ